MIEIKCLVLFAYSRRMPVAMFAGRSSVQIKTGFVSFSNWPRLLSLPWTTNDLVVFVDLFNVKSNIALATADGRLSRSHNQNDDHSVDGLLGTARSVNISN